MLRRRNGNSSTAGKRKGLQRPKPGVSVSEPNQRIDRSATKNVPKNGGPEAFLRVLRQKNAASVTKRFCGGSEKMQKTRNNFQLPLRMNVDSKPQQKNRSFSLCQLQKALLFQHPKVTLEFYHGWVKKSALCPNECNIFLRSQSYA